MSALHVKCLLILMFCLPASVIAQSMTEKYCHLQILKHGNHIKVNINYGNKNAPIFRDSSVVVQLENLTKLTNDVDVLNSIAKNGWILVGLTDMVQGTYVVSNFYFKRIFSQLELINETN